ncbi:hypothetical protein [Variovorax sp. Sphag1AA]|uniref:hypothetical protein n=1 Tax=Variovorax sp. Sphag1AA TaxID=2587027 RepID=UPI001607EF94|nr:hypothetical protein [Variovorax sp. Sphag1AA]MBB3175899.1 hypothetical protein [Variovorax sp. Sphag1AA]
MIAPLEKLLAQAREADRESSMRTMERDMLQARRRWEAFFEAHPSRDYLLEEMSEFPTDWGLPHVRVVQRDGFWEHLPSSRFGNLELLTVYARLMPFTKERMARALALCWQADFELGPDEDADANAPPWWWRRVLRVVEETEAVQRAGGLKPGQ